MSQYTFTTTVNDVASTVMAGFDPKKAIFFVMVFKGDLAEDPVKESLHLTTSQDLFVQLDRWGVAIPECFESAIDSDVHDWNFGTGDLRFIGRKCSHFGHHEPILKVIRTQECGKARRKLRPKKAQAQ